MSQIAVVLGTARKDNRSQAVTNMVVEALQAAGAGVRTVAVADHITNAVTLPPWGEGGANEEETVWKEIVSQHERLVFVVPEYNHGYPGEWKLLMDSLFQEYAGKRLHQNYGSLYPLFENYFEFEDGCLTVPDLPGLGVVVNEEIMEREKLN